MKHLLFLIKREFKLFLSNSTLRSVFFLAPLVYALLMGFTYQQGKVTDIPVIVVNHDQTPLSQKMIDMLEDNTSIHVLNYVEQPVDLKDEVIKQDAAAVVVIPERFEAMMLQKKYPEVNVFINTSNVLTANFATKAVQLTLGTFSAGASISALQKKGLSATEASNQYEPFKANYITLFNTTSNYLIFMWPALMAVVLQQVILLAMAVSFAEEFKRRSFFEAYKGKEKQALLMMLIKSLPVWLFSLVNIAMFYLLSVYFKVPAPDNVINFLLVTGFFVVSATNLGIVFSIILPDSLKATQILMVIASPAFIISGFTWPLYAMPEAIKLFTAIIPLTPYLEALKIMLIQYGSDYLTYPFIWHLVILTLAYFVLGWIALKIKLRFLFKSYNAEIVMEEQKEIIE